MAELERDRTGHISEQGEGYQPLEYVKCKDNPRFSKYFRMEKMGVPRPAVAIKLKQETGFDGSMLDTPDAPAPPGGGGGEGADDEVDSEDSD